jgi:hypothetical protein
MLHNLQIHTATVQQPTPTKGTSGGEKVSWTNTVSNMPCRVLDVSATWSVFYAQRQIQVSHQVYTNQGPTVKAGYQLVWNNRTLRVVAVYDKGGSGNVTQIDCQEIYGG